MCAVLFSRPIIHAHSHLTHISIHTHIHTAEAVEQGITINSLEWLGSIYKHVEMLFTMSDWMDYTSTQTSEGNTLNIHNVYTGRERDRERGRMGLSTSLHKVPEWHVLESEINIQ